jgi:hypothetical protein
LSRIAETILSTLGFAREWLGFGSIARRTNSARTERGSCDNPRWGVLGGPLEVVLLARADGQLDLDRDHRTEIVVQGLQFLARLAEPTRYAQSITAIASNSR